MYDTENATFEDLLDRSKSRTIHEDVAYTLLVEIYISTHYINPPIMWNFFNLRNRYNICSNYLLKLPDTSTCRYGTQALCFKRSLPWNKIPNKYNNLNSLQEFKSQIKQSNPTTCSSKNCK